MMVNRVPISRKKSVEKIPISVKFCTKDNTSGLFCRSGMAPFKKSSPIKRKANPKMNSPSDLFLLFDENISGRAIPINGMDKVLIENFPNPNKEIIQAVTVVPIFAPMITPMD